MSAPATAPAPSPCATRAARPVRLDACVTHRPAKNADIAMVRCARLRVSAMISRWPNMVRMPTNPRNTATPPKVTPAITVR